MRFSVDGAEYEAQEGQTILQALDAAGVLMDGVDIPHYCWHPKLAIDGSCRMCQVEVEGRPKLQIACDTPVTPGMVVHTRSERVRRAREGVMELLLLNHPLDCPICDQAGECKLQDYAFDYGLAAARTREPRRAGAKRVDLGPTIVFDQERCILCRRCVRFCREVPGTAELAVLGRGDRSVIGTFPGEALDNPYSMNVADICPVGALTTKDFRFKIRVWFLEDVPSVCSGCSRGCNIDMGIANDKVQRYVPRRNDAVNDTWICDAGRLSYQEVARPDRLAESMRRMPDGRLEVCTYPEAVETAARRLRRLVDARGPGVLAGVASARATVEELHAFRRLLRALGSEHSWFAVREGPADDLLVCAEKAPNAAGARALGFGEATHALDRIRGGGVDGLILFGSEMVDEAFLGREEGAQVLSRLDTLVVIDTHHSELDLLADVLLPARHAAEQRGSFVNHAGRVQAIAPGVEPAFEAHDLVSVSAMLGAALGLEAFAAEVAADGDAAREAIARAISREVEAFADIDLLRLGPAGVPLPGAGREHEK